MKINDLNFEKMEVNLKNSISKCFRLQQEGENRYRLFTPFIFSDGDLMSFILKFDSSLGWILTDEENTFMRISIIFDSYKKLSFSKSTIEYIDYVLDGFPLCGVDGKEILLLINNFESIGDAVIFFVQAIITVMNIECQLENEVMYKL